MAVTWCCCRAPYWHPELEHLKNAPGRARPGLFHKRNPRVISRELVSARANVRRAQMVIARSGVQRLLGCAMLLVGMFGALPAAAAVASDGVRITILYDAFGKKSPLQKDWGYSAFVEYGEKRILFDTGDNPEILEKN